MLTKNFLGLEKAGNKNNNFMAKDNLKKENTTDELLRDLLIVQLGLAGLTQHQIREIVGVDIHRVNCIVKHFKKINK